MVGFLLIFSLEVLMRLQEFLGEAEATTPISRML